MNLKAFLVCVLVAILLASSGSVMDVLFGTRFEAGASTLGIAIHNIIYGFVGITVCLGVVLLFREQHIHVSEEVADMYAAAIPGEYAGNPLLSVGDRCPRCREIIEAAEQRWMDENVNRPGIEALVEYDLRQGQRGQM